MKRVVVAAFKEEIRDFDLSDGFDFLITGPGKLSAALSLEQYVTSVKPDQIINIGTAGSNLFSVGTVVSIGRVYQRDTTFRSESYELVDIFNTKAICGTGDRVEKIEANVPWSVVDMELYALAKVAWNHQIPLISLKYITDNGFDLSFKTWTSMLPQASMALVKAWLIIRLNK